MNLANLFLSLTEKGSKVALVSVLLTFLNLAENSIRPFTIGRKNRGFLGTQKGAKASATVYSLVETVKANNLNA